MKCPNCGAESTGRYCDYCGSELPKNGPDTIFNDNSNIVINNYYQTTTVHQSKPQMQPTSNTAQGLFSPTISRKSKNITLFLCIFLGYLGAHQFYTRKIGWVSYIFAQWGYLGLDG